jgi:hypothetical protein
MMSLFDEPWLTFPRLLSNTSAAKNRMWNHHHTSSSSASSLMANLLDIDGHEKILGWTQTVWKRYVSGRTLLVTPISK